MKVWIHVFVFTASSLAVYSQTCPSNHFSAVLTVTLDQITTSPGPIDDPGLTFFKTYMKFRDSAIQHTIDDAIQFFNNTFSLDFSDSPPNEKNERFFQSAKMSPFIFPPEFDFIVTDNRWIRTGNTHSLCYSLSFGGFQVTFSSDQTLYGSYGGVEGKPAGIGDTVGYGFFNIDACKQSPLIIQVQSKTPTRSEPIDGSFVFAHDLYNPVLGYGTGRGVIQVYPDPNEPDVTQPEGESLHINVIQTTKSEAYVGSAVKVECSQASYRLLQLLLSATTHLLLLV